MESIGIGLVIVSHSKHIAEGVVELISKVAKDVPITYVGGTEGGGIGTSFDQVDRVVSENPADTLLAFFDLGSAKMNLKMVTDFSDKSIIINRVPIVEGAYNAAALLQAGAELSVIQIYFNRSETIVFLNCESIKTDCDGAILALETFKN